MTQSKVMSARADAASVTTIEASSCGYPDDDVDSMRMDVDGPATPGKVPYVNDQSKTVTRASSVSYRRKTS